MANRLSDEQKSICAMMGVSPEDYAKQLERDHAEEVAALKVQQGLTDAQLAVCRVMGVDPKNHPDMSSTQRTGVAACTLSRDSAQDIEVAALIRRYTVIR